VLHEERCGDVNAKRDKREGQAVGAAIKMLLQTIQAAVAQTELGAAALTLHPVQPGTQDRRQILCHHGRLMPQPSHRGAGGRLRHRRLEHFAALRDEAVEGRN
jgi:hypothetical protein